MNKKTIEARSMRATDAQAVCRMIRALGAFHGDKIKINLRELTVIATGPKKISDILVAFSNKRPVGFAATYDWMNFVRGTKVRHIDLIFVSSKYRGFGIGSLLIKAIAKSAAKAGCMRVTVGAIEDNEQANALYKRLGFEKREDRSTRYFLAGSALEQLLVASDADQKR
jgi:ribosomal protein S18 acetylase RimI-like enzyme